MGAPRTRARSTACSAPWTAPNMMCRFRWARRHQLSNKWRKRQRFGLPDLLTLRVAMNDIVHVIVFAALSVLSAKS
jgi:hypothetical protein